MQCLPGERLFGERPPAKNRNLKWEQMGEHPPPFDAQRLTGNIGVEVASAPKLASLKSAEVEALKVLVSTHCVAVFRDQFLSPEDLLQLAQGVGALTYTPGLIQNTRLHNVYRIDNPGKENAATESWHTDGIYSRLPPSYTLLSASRVPDVGGDTLFINQYVSYDALSLVFKGFLRGLRVRYVGLIDNVPETEDNEHPIARFIPESGKTALYVNKPRLAGRISGMTAKESYSFIDFLYNHSIAIDRMYRHRWRAGDLIIWDNRCTLHAAAHDYGSAERVLFRAMIEGERPIEGGVI
jgi:taurine dioxygenase